MSHDLFAYGTLMVREVFDRVAGGHWSALPARIDNYAAYKVNGTHYPALVPKVGESQPGTFLTGIDTTTLLRLDAYEGQEFKRSLLPVRVFLDQNKVEDARTAWVYLLKPGYRNRLTRERWSTKRFAAEWLAEYLRDLETFELNRV